MTVSDTIVSETDEWIRVEAERGRVFSGRAFETTILMRDEE